MFSGLISALRLLSAIPVPGRESDDFTDGLPWYPVAGAILGWLVCGLSLLVLSLVPDWSELVALAAVVASVLVTRGFHLDGVADCADGFWGGHSRERRLEIMKDSSTGAFGVIALVVVLSPKWVAYSRIVKMDTLILVPLAFAISRFMIVLLARSFSYPRERGTGAAIVRGAKAKHLLYAAVSAGLMCLYAPLSAVPAFLVGAGIAVGVGLYSRSKIGGVSGDVLGAACELTEVGVLIAIALGS